MFTLDLVNERNMFFDVKSSVVFEWRDHYGNQRFRYGPGEQDVMWLSGADRIKEKFPLGSSGTLTCRDGKWFFEPHKK